jgi:hypothetical protein
MFFLSYLYHPLLDFLKTALIGAATMINKMHTNATFVFVALLNSLISNGFLIKPKTSNAVDSHDYGEFAIESIQLKTPICGDDSLTSTGQSRNLSLPDINGAYCQLQCGGFRFRRYTTRMDLGKEQGRMDMTILLPQHLRIAASSSGCGFVCFS